MRTLILIRHGKSSWAEPAGPDRERELDARGQRDAPAMGRRLAKRGVKPDLIISSPARRALSTARLIAAELNARHRRITVDERLYAATPLDLLAVVQGLDAHLHCVMLIGHNPGLSEFAHALSDEVAELPTCGVAAMEFDVKSWPEIDRATLASVDLDRPEKH